MKTTHDLVFLAVVLFLVATGHARAAEYDAVVNFASWHPDSSSFNQVNPGLGLRKNFGNDFVQVGVYKNSLSNTSVYVGGGKILYTKDRYSIAVGYGFVTGYEYNVVPFVVPEVGVVVWKGVSLLIDYVPRIGDKISQAFGFSLKVPLE